jgi:hypothetical protein
MKNIVLIATMLLSFAAFSQTDNGWEPWQQTSCYSKISFHIKYVEQRGEQNVWLVQFKNEYPSVISFNYNVTDKLQEHNSTTHRKTLNQGQTSNEMEVFTTEEDLYLVVEKVSLSPYPQDYIECDQE